MTGEQGLTLAHTLVPDILDELGIDPDGAVGEHATELARRAALEHPVNRAPSVVAAGAVYLAGLLKNRERSQPAVAEASGVSEVAVRDAYFEIAEHEGISTKRTRRQERQSQEVKNGD